MYLFIFLNEDFQGHVLFHPQTKEVSHQSEQDFHFLWNDESSRSMAADKLTVQQHLIGSS